MFCHRVNEDIELKLLELRDADALFALTDVSRTYLRQWLPWVDVTKTSDDSRTFIQSTLQQFCTNKGFQAGILFRGELSGVIGLHEVNWPNRSTAIGYWLGEGFQGRGIMTSACQAVVNIAFEEYGLNRLEVRAAVENRKSRAIPERLGFQTEGVSRQAEWIYDHFVDLVIYGMLADDWRHEGISVNNRRGI